MMIEMTAGQLAELLGGASEPDLAKVGPEGYIHGWIKVGGGLAGKLSNSGQHAAAGHVRKAVQHMRSAGEHHKAGRFKKAIGKIRQAVSSLRDAAYTATHKKHIAEIKQHVAEMNKREAAYASAHGFRVFENE